MRQLLTSRGEWPSDHEDDEDFQLSDDEKESVLEIWNFPKIFAYTNLLWTMVRRDSMFSAFRMGPAASGRGLCDIDGVIIHSNKWSCLINPYLLHFGNIQERHLWKKKIQNLCFDLWWRHTLPITYDVTWIWNYTS